MKRCSEPRSRASRAQREHRRVPSTLIAPRLGQRQVEGDRGRAVQHPPRRSASSAAPRGPRPGRSRSAGTARTRSRYGGAVPPQRRQDDVEPRLGPGASRSPAPARKSRGVAPRAAGRAPPAEEAGGSRQQIAQRAHGTPTSGRNHGSSGLARRSAIGAPIAWKPPSTWRISPVIAAGPVREQDARAGHRAGVVDVPAQRRLLVPHVVELLEAGDAARRQRRSGPAATRFTRMPSGRGRGPGSARSTRAPPWRRPSSRRPATPRWRRSRGRRVAPPSGSAGGSADGERLQRVRAGRGTR